MEADRCRAASTKARKKLYCRGPLKLGENVAHHPLWSISPANYIFPLHEELQDAQMRFLKPNLKIMRQMLDTTCSWQRPLSGSVWKRFNLARCCSSKARPPSLLQLSSLRDLGPNMHRARSDSKKNVDNLELPIAFGFFLVWQKNWRLHTYVG